MRNEQNPRREKLEELYKLLQKVPVERRPNLAILTENDFLFLYKDKLSWSRFLGNRGPVSGIAPVRGDVMDFFARVELMVNQIFVVNLVKSSEADVTRLEQLLDCVELFQKLRLLNEWSLIDGRTKQLMFCLKEVRNGFAHNWDIKAVKYKGKPILQNFGQFKHDAEAVFGVLIKLYNGHDIDVEKVIDELSAYVWR
jgi:hypothetical protein